MFTQRLRGIINLHAAAVTIAALGLFMIYAYGVRYQTIIALSYEIDLTPYVVCVLGAMLFSGRFLHHLAGEFHHLSWAQAAWLASRQILTIVVVVFAFMFAFKDRGMSRLFMSSYLVVCWVMLLFLNRRLPQVFSRMFFEQGRSVPTLFVGSLGSLARLKDWLSTKTALGMHPVGFISLEGEPKEPIEPPYLGSIGELADQISKQRIGQVMLLEIPRTSVEGRFVIESCQNQGCRLLIYSNLAEQLRHPLITVTEGGHQFYTLQEEPLEDPLNRILKRTLDIVIALPVVVLALPPLMVVVWLMQRSQAPGRLFHVQERTGYAHRRFRMLKFRSMYDVTQDAAAEAQQAKKGDARIYPFGRLLRKTSLDEFPQFWNVLIGQMSAVGPRPHLPVHDDLFAKQMNAYRTRFFVKPGITGLAQCRGFRGEITDPALLQNRVSCDLEYIANWSIWSDFLIIAKTVQQVVFPPKSAY